MRVRAWGQVAGALLAGFLGVLLGASLALFWLG